MQNHSDQLVFLGLSGGVDSSVSAYLLQKQGYQLEAVFMKNWEDDDNDTQCSQEQDLKDAQAVCDALNIPLHVVNFANEYWQNVFAHFLDEYRAGRTPNPDILCNKEIKFKAFLDYAKQKGADFIATGHYVQKKEINGYTCLMKGLDSNKDQSYFLYALNHQQLAASLFPIGHMKKQEVRQIAAEIGLINHAKKDSTGICFIGEKKFKQFLNEYLPAQPGEIITTENEVIGKHHGLMFHTIGQRQGLEIGGLKGKDESPWYVVDKDINNNKLIVAQGNNNPALFKQNLIVSQINWITEEPNPEDKIQAKIRYRQEDQPCTLSKQQNGYYLASFDQAQRAVTPGQSVVFYRGDICLGGGIIVE